MEYPPCSWVGKLNVANMPIFHKLIYKFNIIPIKIQVGFKKKKEIDKQILKWIWKFKECRIAKRNNQLMWYWHKAKYYQWNRIENSKTRPHTYCQFIFDKSATINHWGRRVFPTGGNGTTVYPHIKHEAGTLPHIIHQNELKMDYRFKCKN